MALRRRTNLRRTAYPDSVKDTVIRDVESLINRDGGTVTFEWIEVVGGVWNEDYEVWEGGEEKTLTMDVKGLGKVVDYKEDIVEYEWGRIGVGEALIRFSINFNIEQFANKEQLRIIYKGQRWRVDSPLGVCEYYRDDPYCKFLKGVKAVD